MRRVILCLMLLAAGCRAQAPAPASAGLSPELSRGIERQFRASFNLPPMVDIAVAERAPSTDFPGYDRVVVKLSYGTHTQTHEALLSRDGKTLYSLTKMDLTHDPLAELMARIDVTGRPVRGRPGARRG